MLQYFDLYKLGKTDSWTAILTISQNKHNLSCNFSQSVIFPGTKLAPDFTWILKILNIKIFFGKTILWPLPLSTFEENLNESQKWPFSGAIVSSRKALGRIFKLQRYSLQSCLLTCFDFSGFRYTSLDEIGIDTKPTLWVSPIYTACIDRVRFSFARSVFLTKFSTDSILY